MSSLYAESRLAPVERPSVDLTPIEIGPLVRRLNALYPLHSREVGAISGLIHEVVSVGSHQIILNEGQSSGDVFVLLEGLACHHRVLDTARRQITGFVVPGDFCDFSFLSSSPVRQCVMSFGNVVLGRVNLRQLGAMSGEFPNIVVAIMRAAAIEQASACELVISLGARDALQRLAHFFCEMHNRLRIVGLVSAGGQFELGLTQAELGEALGLSTVHVNRTIQQLRKKELISMAQGTVRIIDFPELAKLASFDGLYLRPN